MIGCPQFTTFISNFEYIGYSILSSGLIETASVKSTRLSHVEGDKKDQVELEAHILYAGSSVSIVSTGMVDLS